MSTHYIADGEGTVRFADLAAATLEADGHILLRRESGKGADETQMYTMQGEPYNDPLRRNEALRRGGSMLEVNPAPDGSRYFYVLTDGRSWVSDLEWSSDSAEDAVCIGGTVFAGGGEDPSSILDQLGLTISEHDDAYYADDEDEDYDGGAAEIAESLVLEAPMDTGDLPDYIHPGNRREIEQEFKHPAIPQYAQDAFASRSYRKTLDRVGKHADVRNPHQLMAMQAAAQQALVDIAGIERQHKPELEQLAVSLVLGLPEFTAAREAKESGDLIIDAKLEKPQLDKTKLDPDAPSQDEQDVQEIADELASERAKRRFFNMMIQGNATAKMGAYHLVSSELEAIDPGLLNLYSLITSAGLMGYWMVPPETARSQMGSGAGAGGSSAVQAEEDGRTKIVARATSFPLLVHELVKGLMEFISYDDDLDDDTRQKVYGHTDTLSNEPLDIRIGPELWQALVNAIGTKDAKAIPYVYDALLKLPANEFNRTMAGVLGKTSSGKAALDAIIAKARQAMAKG